VIAGRIRGSLCGCNKLEVPIYDWIKAGGRSLPLQAEERTMGVGPLFISRVIAFLVIVLFLSARTPAETFTTLRGALEEVAAKYQIQVGLEYATNDKDLQPITLNLSAKSVDTVLTRLISQKTDYAWSLADSVYDVYPNSIKAGISNWAKCSALRKIG